MPSGLLRLPRRLHQLKGVNSIRNRITLWAGAAILFTIAVVVTYDAVKSYGQAMYSARSYAVSMADAYAHQLESKMASALASARTLAQTLSAIKDPDIELAAGREDVFAIQKALLQANPVFAGVFSCWEADLFDGLHKGYMGQPGHDQTGRLIPHWSRSEDGKVALTALTDYETPGT